MSRLDVYLVEASLAKSRERAKKLIKDGAVTVNEKVSKKPSFEVGAEDNVKLIKADMSYVGRGLLKLETAFKAFGLDVSGKVCADIGASTGGFTQCLLESGAEYVYAVDVGHGQLDESLVKDPRVKNCEGVNARYLTQDFFDKPVEFMSADLSFISLSIVMPALAGSVEENGIITALIKPQFEAGRKALSKGGIVKDPKDHKRVLEELLPMFERLGLAVKGLVCSNVKGGDGNIEYLVCLRKSKEKSDFLGSFDIGKFVADAFAKFK